MTTRHYPSRLLLVVLALAVFALASTPRGRSSEGAAGEAQSAAAAAAPAGRSQGRVNSEIELDVTGGAHAGHYTAKVTAGGCSYGLAGEGSWGNQYSIDTEDPKTFSSLQLVVPDTKAAVGGTKEFQMTVGFGSLLGGGTSYTIDPRREQGEGTVTVEDRGRSGTVTFDTKTQDGVGLKGTIKCHSVLRAG